MEHVFKALGLNKLDYLNQQTYQFNKWCHNYAKNSYVSDSVLQHSRALYKWYCENWDKMVVNFYNDNKDFIGANIINPKLYQDLFFTEVIKPMLGIYPKTIISKLKKEHYESLQNKNRVAKTKTSK